MGPRTDLRQHHEVHGGGDLRGSGGHRGRDWEELPGELGDLLLQVLFYAEMAGEAGHFSIDTVLETLSDKLVRRHPHVFGDVEAETSPRC